MKSQKTVKLSRDELVWETREVTRTEEDYEKLLDTLKNSDRPSDENHAEYHTLSQYTWDGIVDLLNSDISNKEPFVQYYRKGKPTCRIPVRKVIQEYIREDNYRQKVCDSDYADDYREEWSYEVVSK